MSPGRAVRRTAFSTKRKKIKKVKAAALAFFIAAALGGAGARSAHAPKRLRGAGTYAVMGARMVPGMWSLVGATRHVEPSRGYQAERWNGFLNAAD